MVFMKSHHARCIVDGMFGIGKRRIRRSDWDSLVDFQCCVELYPLYTHMSSNSWQWRDWNGFCFQEIIQSSSGNTTIPPLPLLLQQSRY